MDRKEFFKKASLFGFCTCAGMSLLSATDAFANEKTFAKDDPDWRIGFMKNRICKLIEMINCTVDEKNKSKIIEGMGRECAKLASDENKKYVGDIDAFLKNMETSFAEKATYDKDKKEIKIIGKKTDKCFCPFVDKSKMPKDFCSCSVGWQKETMKYILGKEVSAQVDTSVLRGDPSCNFTIKIL